MIDSINNDTPALTDADISTDFRIELENFCQNNTSENLIENFNIDSKYYEIEDLNCDSAHFEENHSYKYNTLHINIQGLRSSMEHLKHIINKLEQNDIHIDFILICETFLLGSDLDLVQTNHCSITGYELVCKNRKHKAKGGVAIYIKNNHKFIVRNDLSTFIEGEFECIFVEVKAIPYNAIIGEIYRVPNTPEQLSIVRYDETLGKVLSNKSHDIIIAGDQNFDYMKINTHNHTADLFDLHVSHGLIPTITRPTRITHSTATLIDNIYIKLHNEDLLHSGILTIKLSDHMPVFAFYGKQLRKKPKPVKIKTREFNEANISRIKEKLERYDWTDLNTLDANDGYDIFSGKLHSIINKISPEKTITIPSKKVIREPWVTKGIMKSSHSLDKLYRKSLTKSKDHPVNAAFRTYRNKFNKLKKIAKQNYYHDLFNKYKTNARKTWEVMRSIINKNNDKSNISDTFKIGNCETQDPSYIANAFCEYFTNVGSNLSAQIPKSNKTYNNYLHKNVATPSRSLFLYPTDDNEIKSTIKLLKPKKSTGPDDISSWLLKQINESICKPLSILINKSMENGTFPNTLKLAKIVPIYKSKAKDELSNYRPISLLSSISKVFEQIIYKRLYNFINESLYTRQYGFRAKRTTVQAIAELYIDVIDSWENKKSTLATFLDLSKAFDTIDHNILINKLNFYGIRGVALSWFQSYLCERKHFIQYKSHNSVTSSITCGVPQGSVLGPLLFIIYTNDLPNCLKHAKCILFADDTTVYLSSPNLSKLYDSLNYDLNNLTDWFRANKLSLNVGKTMYLLFKNKHDHVQINNYNVNIGSEIIKRVQHTKFLGLIIDDQLQWAAHIKHVKSKLSSSLYAIRTAKHILSISQLKTLYYSMVHPYLEYGLLLWGAAHRTHLKPLEIIQRKSIRLINNSSYNAHTKPIFKKINILTLCDLYTLHIDKFMYEYHHNNLPNSLNNIFIPNHDFHSYNTRHREDPHILSRRTAFAGKSLLHQGPKLWNEIPREIKDLKSIHMFTRKIKNTLTKLY